MNMLEKLLYQRGVSSEYFSYSGERQSVPLDTRVNFLRAMNYDVDDSSQLEREVFNLDAHPWRSWLPAVSFAKQGAIELRVHPDELESLFEFNIVCDDKSSVCGEITPSELPESGEYYIGDVRYTARQWTLPEIPHGYHSLQLSNDGAEKKNKLIYAPEQCYQLNHDVSDEKVFGISCQLYTLRSERNWGIGDFADLRELINLSADFGVDMIGLNPLHAPMSGGVNFASPYSPSDRRFLNPIYIAPELVPEFRQSAAVQAHASDPVLCKELLELRALEYIDYSQVATKKNRLFDLLFDNFAAVHLANESARAKQYWQFVADGGEKLRKFCDFEIAQAKLSQAHAELNSPFNDAPNSPFNSALDHRYYSYLQWLAQEQLAGCQSFAMERGMRVGLMADLAVGAVKNGSEVIANPKLYGVSATIGAPGDQFTAQGQNWDLPAIDPTALKDTEYQHFIDLMRANMAHCGALRIDHVMGLMRLWWWLENSKDGAYVYYPLEHLLTILRIESHRNSCLVVGEDMGVVSDEFRQKMSESAITKSKVFLFETNHDGSFIDPRSQPRDTLLMVTNHDVPTLAGWWAAHDIKSRSEYGLLDSSDQLSAQLAQRHEQKRHLLEWLKQLNLLPEDWHPEDSGTIGNKPLDLTLCAAIIRANARTNCEFMLYQLDDLQLINEPVNIPGTFLEYPNWQRKQHLQTSTIFADPKIKNILTSIHTERRS
jgi:4-alpha-glucanotransferase